MELKKIIFIGGGVGPLAGLHLHRLIVESTPGVSQDQDHLGVVHVSIPGKLPDRTDALLQGDPAVPGEMMATLLARSAEGFISDGIVCVVGVACNTFHAPPIWQPFCNTLGGLLPDVEILNMLTECVASIAGERTRAPIGLLTTMGSHRLGLYRKPLEAEGFTVVEPGEEEIEAVHRAIYNPDWGIKATTSVSKRARSELVRAVGELAGRGAERIILGCTELPIALPERSCNGVQLIDPMSSLASGIVKSVLATQ